MLLAVFGDLHGNLMAAYDAVVHWEHRHRAVIDAVLLAGDVGLFHDPRKADGATVRHYLRDPTELCGVLYANGLLKPTHPTYFVRGNHEDFDHLLARKGEAVDPAGLMVHVWADRPVTLGEGETSCRIGGLGGIDGARASEKRRRARAGREYFDPEEIEALERRSPRSLDILLTHDGPLGRSLVDKPGAGSEVITRLVQHLQPRYHFFGHYGRPPPPFQIGRTLVVPMEQEGVWQVPGRHTGMGVVDTAGWSFRFVEPHEVATAPPGCEHCIDRERAPRLLAGFLDERGVRFTPETGWNPPARRRRSP